MPSSPRTHRNPMPVSARRQRGRALREGPHRPKAHRAPSAWHQLSPPAQPPADSQRTQETRRCLRCPRSHFGQGFSQTEPLPPSTLVGSPNLLRHPWPAPLYVVRIIPRVKGVPDPWSGQGSVRHSCPIGRTRVNRGAPYNAPHHSHPGKAANPCSTKQSGPLFAARPRS